MASFSRSVREKCELAMATMNMSEVRGKNFLPKSSDMYRSQYLYSSKNYAGDLVPLTGEVIDSLLTSPCYGKEPQVNKGYIKKSVIFADALFHPEFLQPYLIKCKAGTFLDIFPHQYIVPCNDPVHNKCAVGFVEIIDKSRNSFTIGSVLDDLEIYHELLNLQPDCININIGLADIMQENISWHNDQIPVEFVKKLEKLIYSLQLYFFTAGSRGAFAEKLTYTLNLLPMYTALDAEQHNIQNPFQTVQHQNLWGTNYYNVTRDEYKKLADAINTKLHKGAEIFFDKYQLVLLKPTPKWRSGDLHINRQSGLPMADMHNEIIRNFLFALARIHCDRRICTIGINCSRTGRNPDKHLKAGCVTLYNKAVEDERTA